jgi:small basic protein (TIGR04137 family)
MSIHSSLRGADSLVGQRSVLTRIERIQQLQKEGRFDEEQDSVFGLPKVKTLRKAKKKKESDDTAEGAEASEAPADGDAPAEA